MNWEGEAIAGNGRTQLRAGQRQSETVHFLDHRLHMIVLPVAAGITSRSSLDCRSKEVVNSALFGAVTRMDSNELRANRVQFRVMSDEDLWWIFVHHRKECSSEFWQELENRKAAGTLSESSPFWAVYNLGRHLQTHAAVKKSNLIELTSEEWEARRRRKIFRVIPP